MKNVKKIIAGLVSVLMFVLCFFALQRLVMPKYVSGVQEGNFTAEYYKETTKHDVIFIGDCEVYENINPMYLWENYGITSYIRGNAQQLVWQSYYMLKDTLKREKPKVVVYNVQALTYDKPQKEEYNRMTLDGMRWSMEKYNAIQASMCEKEQFLDYVFPILRYHDRIMDLKKEDFTYFFQSPHITHNGYYMRIDVLGVSESDVADASWLFSKQTTENEEDTKEDTEEDGEEENFGEIEDPWGNIEGAQEEAGESEHSPKVAKSHTTEKITEVPMNYLDKMREICEENQITFILMKAPSLAPEWYDSYNEQIVAYAQEHNLLYINFYELLEETGIDYEQDTYDGGLHMNLSGANKLSQYLGAVFTKQCNISSHRGEEELEKVYKEKVKFYEKMIQQQKEELEKENMKK